MNEKVDLLEYESGMQALIEKLQFPKSYTGEEMTDEQKRAALIQSAGIGNLQALIARTASHLNADHPTNGEGKIAYTNFIIHRVASSSESFTGVSLSVPEYC